MKKLLLLLFFIGVISIPLTYAESVKSIVIKFNDSSDFTINVSGLVSIDFLENDVKITSNNVETSFTISTIKSFIYVKNNTSTTQTLSDNLHISISKDYIYINNIVTDKDVRIYDLKGMLIPVSLSYSSDSITINLQNIVSGIYILNIGTKLVKFRKL